MNADALPVEVHIHVPRERDSLLALQFRDEVNQAVDLTGDTVSCRVYRTIGGVKAIDPDPTVTVDAPATAGNATLTLTVAQTTDGQTGGTITGWHYVIDRLHAGKLTAWFQGDFYIHPVASE